MWPIRDSVYAKGFLIVLLGSEGQRSLKALVEDESELLFFPFFFHEYMFSYHFVAFSVKCNPNYFCFVLHWLRAM